MEALNEVIVVVDGDISYLVKCNIWYNMSILSWPILISLSRSGTIGQDEVEVTTCTIFLVVFKANESVKGTVFLQHLFNHCRTWELKNWSRTF